VRFNVLSLIRDMNREGQPADEIFPGDGRG
jgi:hypothetical protein